MPSNDAAPGPDPAPRGAPTGAPGPGPTRGTSRRTFLFGGLAFGSTAFLAACTSNSVGGDTTTAGTTAGPTTSAGTASGTGAVTSSSAAVTDNPGGKMVKIGFSAPAADHGWMASITDQARKFADSMTDIEANFVEGTNDVNQQISQVETLINAGVDAIVLLPFDGAQMTEVARKAMDAGIEVVNVDRVFSSPFSYRTYIGGDNYGMGVSAGTFIGQQLKDNGVTDPVIAEIQGIASLPLTVDRSKGFADALNTFGFSVTNQVSAEFTADSGEEVTANLLQAAPRIDAIWNHDDDQGVGVLAAIETAGRSEFFMVGGAGSANVMRAIKDDNTVLKATVIYPSTQAASGVELARLLVLEKGMSDLEELEVPKSITLFSAVVTKENVDSYLPSAFES
ncbi:substrate-binding domain-containing protein [Nakamurella sp. YIM 132087]|uniref:Substrate-binding domain-containing protein n=1 Tax=Nakamurella alba TaxID=2665158 RepID=A0A7K1FIE6_9ACTN|nr:substrate-binding domain-containing protein [Nakamurella alba]MTD13897.1 substrate-binding domain-containing protein [Nakamurella alba]